MCVERFVTIVTQLRGYQPSAKTPGQGDLRFCRLARYLPSHPTRGRVNHVDWLGYGCCWQLGWRRLASIVAGFTVEGCCPFGRFNLQEFLNLLAGKMPFILQLEREAHREPRPGLS